MLSGLRSVAQGVLSHRAVIENLINYNKLIADIRLLAEGWKNDMATNCEVTNPAGPNTGLTGRTAWVSRSRVMTLIGPPNLDLFHQEKLIPANFDLPLKLIPNRSGYLLKTASPACGDHPQVNYKVKIMEARLFIRTKHISRSLILGLERVLQSKNYSIPFNNVIIKLYRSLRLPHKLNLIRYIRENCLMWLFWLWSPIRT